jgi:predicted SAM-dependent methyltransferase
MFDSKKYTAGAEVDKCRNQLAKFCLGDGLDIGCGGVNTDNRFYQENKIVPTAIGVDLARTNLTGRAGNLHWFADECLDYIFSSHLLEHLPEPQLALEEWFRVLKKDGYLVLYLPLKDCYPNVGESGANRDHKHNLNPETLLKWLSIRELKFQVVLIEERKDKDEYSFDFVVRKL